MYSQRSPSGFGAFHLAVLSVAARFFDREAWTDNLLNQEEAVVCKLMRELQDPPLTRQ